MISSPPWKTKNEKRNTSFEKTSQSAELTQNGNESEDEKTTNAPGKQKKLTNHSLQKLDHPNSLPQKSGKIDQELYTKFKKDGLRRRLWDAVKQGHCTRCGSTEHLRSKCVQEAKGWEADFNKGAEFWIRTAGKLAVNGKQASMQVEASGQSAVLCVRIEDELVVLDSASDVSLARVDALSNVHDLYAGLSMAHIEGQMILSHSRRGLLLFLVSTQ